MAQTVVIVDDHPMCRQATAMALGIAAPDAEIIEASCLAEARNHAGAARLMTLDLSLPDNRSVLGLPGMVREFPSLRLLVISGAANQGIEYQVAASGAHGYLSKATPIATMIDAVRTVMAGETWFSFAADEPPPPSDGDFDRLGSLTPAQMRVLRAMEGGKLNKQIAFDLGLSEITVKVHAKAIFKKLGVPNRTQAVLMLQRVEA